MRPPLGPVPWLPPRGWCTHTPTCEHCPRPLPIGGPHLFALADASLPALRAVHVLADRGMT